VLLGALPDEVGIMNGLTVNEHLQMVKRIYTVSLHTFAVVQWSKL